MGCSLWLVRVFRPSQYGAEGPRQRADTVRMAGCEKRTGEEGANQRDVSKRKKTNRNLIIDKGEKRNKESG